MGRGGDPRNSADLRLDADAGGSAGTGILWTFCGLAAEIASNVCGRRWACNFVNSDDAGSSGARPPSPRPDIRCQRRWP